MRAPIPGEQWGQTRMLLGSRPTTAEWGQALGWRAPGKEPKTTESGTECRESWRWTTRNFAWAPCPWKPVMLKEITPPLCPWKWFTAKSRLFPTGLRNTRRFAHDKVDTVLWTPILINAWLTMFYSLTNLDKIPANLIWPNLNQASLLPSDPCQHWNVKQPLCRDLHETLTARKDIPATTVWPHYPLISLPLTQFFLYSAL